MVGVLKQGKFNITKEAFKDAIQAAIPEADVSGNWRQDVGELIRNLPYIYLRFFPEHIDDLVYDRNVGGGCEGSAATYFFSIHIFHSNCNDVNYERGRHAQDVATRLTDYLIVQPPVLGWDIDGVTVRETEPDRGMHRVSRVIVEGQLHITRID